MVVTGPAPPEIAVTVDVSPLTRRAPGGGFTFTVRVSNPTSDDPVTITSVVDDVYGDLATRPGSTCGTLIGTTLVPGATSNPCTFSATFTGAAGASQADTVQVTADSAVLATSAAGTAQTTIRLTSTAPVPPPPPNPPPPPAVAAAVPPLAATGVPVEVLAGTALLLLLGGAAAQVGVRRRPRP